MSGAVRLLVFFVVLIASFVLVNALIYSGLHRVQTSNFGVFNRIVDGRINSTILISGSSRALNHYDPREISGRSGLTAWNIGVNGSQTDLQLAVLQTYLRHNRVPALLIQNLDSFSFVSSKDGIAFPETYVPYLDEPPIYETLRHLDPDWWKARHLPLYGYAVENLRFSWLVGVSALIGRQPSETRFDGFEPRHAVWNEDFSHFRAANPNGVTFKIEPEAVAALEHLIAEVTTRGGRVLLVYSPVYYEMQSLERDRVQLFEMFRNISIRSGATFWDYSESPLAKRQDLFYNSQHLNATGAALFSKDLAERLSSSSLLANIGDRFAEVH